MYKQLKVMKIETYGNKKLGAWQIGLDSEDQSTTGIGVGLYPDLGIHCSIWKFTFEIELKLDKIWEELAKRLKSKS